MLLEQEDVLHRLLIANLSLDKFEQAWAEDISDPSDEICVDVRSWKLPKRGHSTIYLLASGLAAAEDSRGRWSAYATKAWCDERDYFAKWAAFVRGTWVTRVPQQEGTYPTKTLEGARGKDRILIRRDGRLLDVTCCSGRVEYGRVSNWRGFWFSDPYPPLKGAS